MSNYDLLAISQKPDFYFSSNGINDQSGKNLYDITNSAANIGQPIIKGNPSSWKISSSNTLGLDGNPIFFRQNTYMEFVIQKIQTSDTVCIFGDDAGLNGVFVNPTGVQVRFVDANLNQRTAALTFTKWPEKMYILIAFDSAYCTLKVNENISQVSYRETNPDSIASVSFKTTPGNDYYIDGIGFYSSSFESKEDQVNTKHFDYLDFINKTYRATGTLFDGYRGFKKDKVMAELFRPDPLDVNYYIYTMTFPLSGDEDFSSISIESNYAGMAMQYQTNDSNWTSFTGQTSFVPSTDFFLLQIRVGIQDISKRFIIDVFAMFDDRITTNTPAELVPNGGPLYPDQHTVSIVNFPDGVELNEISYEGEWIEYIPNTIEILFMPKNTTKTIVFESADGSVSCGTGGSVSGYSAYLNGFSVANLNNARLNQWNHLVLTMVSPDEQTFFLNSNLSRTQENVIEYALLASYPSVLSIGSIQQLYAIVSSFHKASVVDDPTDINEGELDGTSPFKVYTYAWAIVGGGGI